jgi:hypothetical protein
LSVPLKEESSVDRISRVDAPSFCGGVAVHHWDSVRGAGSRVCGCTPRTLCRMWSLPHRRTRRTDRRRRRGSGRSTFIRRWRQRARKASGVRSRISQTQASGFIFRSMRRAPRQSERDREGMRSCSGRAASSRRRSMASSLSPVIAGAAMRAIASARAIDAPIGRLSPGWPEWLRPFASQMRRERPNHRSGDNSDPRHQAQRD